MIGLVLYAGAAALCFVGMGAWTMAVTHLIETAMWAVGKDPRG